MGRILLGTSSWSEKSWGGGVFYPEGLPAGSWLSHYAGRFPAVEADVTYYRVPSASMVRGWRSKTPEGFVFCAKFPRAVVHGGEGARPDGDAVLVSDEARKTCDAFLEVMRLAGDRLGPLVLQFPYFNRGAFASPEPFLERLATFLDGLPRDLRYVVEVRNEKWMDEPLLALLRERNVAFCLLDLAYVPHPARLAERLDLVTADFLYARLIGDRKAIDALTKTFDREVVDQGERLASWADLLARLAPTVRETLAFVNNHYAGFAPATAQRLAALLRARGLAPEEPSVAPGDLPF